MRRWPQVSSAAPCNDSYVSILSIQNLSAFKSNISRSPGRLLSLTAAKMAALLHHFCGIFRTLFLLAISRKPPLACATKRSHFKISFRWFLSKFNYSSPQSRLVSGLLK